MHSQSMLDSTIFCIKVKASSQRGSQSPTVTMVFGHFKGKRLSPTVPDTYYSVKRTGLASGFSPLLRSPQKQALIQSISIVGQSSGSVIEWILEGEQAFLRSAAGYETYSPLGIVRLFFKIRPVKTQAKLPPAESPAKYTRFGLILKQWSICSMMNLYTVRQSLGACGKGCSGGILQSTEKTGIFSAFAHILVQFCMDRLESATNPPPWKWKIASSIAGQCFFEPQQPVASCSGYFLMCWLESNLTVIVLGRSSKISTFELKTPSAGTYILILCLMPSQVIFATCLIAPFSGKFHICCAISMVGCLQKTKLLNLAESFMMRYCEQENPKLNNFAIPNSQVDSLMTAEAIICNFLFKLLLSLFNLSLSFTGSTLIRSQTFAYSSLGLLVMSLSSLNFQKSQAEQQCNFTYISIYQTALPLQSQSSAFFEFKNSITNLKYSVICCLMMVLCCDCWTRFLLQFRISWQDFRSYQGRRFIQQRQPWIFWVDLTSSMIFCSLALNQSSSIESEASSGADSYAGWAETSLTTLYESSILIDNQYISSSNQLPLNRLPFIKYQS